MPRLLAVKREEARYNVKCIYSRITIWSRYYSMYNSNFRHGDHLCCSVYTIEKRIVLSMLALGATTFLKGISKKMERWTGEVFWCWYSFSYYIFSITSPILNSFSIFYYTKSFPLFMTSSYPNFHFKNYHDKTGLETSPSFATINILSRIFIKNLVLI